MSDLVRSIVAAAINLPIDVVTDDLAMQETVEWDSLKHMEIIVGVEQAFGIELTFDEIVEMKSVGAIRRVLAGRGKA